MGPNADRKEEGGAGVASCDLQADKDAHRWSIAPTNSGDAKFVLWLNLLKRHLNSAACVISIVPCLD